MKDKLDFNELESRFEMQMIVLEDGTLFDTSTMSEQELSDAVDSTCTSSCKPK